jgi:hypothetical protein
MDGDVAPMEELARLRQKHGFLLVVDEAHATLLYGEKVRDALHTNTHGHAVLLLSAINLRCHALKDFEARFTLLSRLTQSFHHAHLPPTFTQGAFIPSSRTLTTFPDIPGSGYRRGS